MVTPAPKGQHRIASTADGAIVCAGRTRPSATPQWFHRHGADCGQTRHRRPGRACGRLWSHRKPPRETTRSRFLKRGRTEHDVLPPASIMSASLDRPVVTAHVQWRVTRGNMFGVAEGAGDGVDRASAARTAQCELPAVLGRAGCLPEPGCRSRAGWCRAGCRPREPCAKQSVPTACSSADTRCGGLETVQASGGIVC